MPGIIVVGVCATNLQREEKTDGLLQRIHYGSRVPVTKRWTPAPNHWLTPALSLSPLCRVCGRLSGSSMELERSASSQPGSMESLTQSLRGGLGSPTLPSASTDSLAGDAAGGYC